MTVAIMQPYFLPYIGYFQLIACVDEFILFDTPQFIRHGWIERNNILKLDGEPSYIKVPLNKHNRNTSINNVTINNSISWQNKLFAQLTHYKKKAPHYVQTLDLLNTILNLKTNSIVELNYHALNVVCRYLDIKTPIKVWSKMNIEIQDVNAPDEWALEICKALGATHYINPIGGQSFFDVTKYHESNIKINFLESRPIPYKQFTTEFEPFLSIVDVLMFNSKEEIKQMLKEFELK